MKSIKASQKLPDGLYQAIEEERVNLIKVQTLLGCLAVSIEYCDEEPQDTPDYDEVVKMAGELVKSSINKLDCLYLEKTLK